jgi:hypothetical protein
MQKYALYCQRTSHGHRRTFVIEWHDSPASLALAWEHHTQRGVWDSVDVYAMSAAAWAQWQAGASADPAQLALPFAGDQAIPAASAATAPRGAPPSSLY